MYLGKLRVVFRFFKDKPVKTCRRGLKFKLFLKLKKPWNLYFKLKVLFKKLNMNLKIELFELIWKLKKL